MASSKALETFISAWSKTGGSELANTQSFVNELCVLIGVDPPKGSRSDESLNDYVFERSVFENNGDGTGLVTIIGARGSGKTALADMVAAGCDALPDGGNQASFLSRARDLLVGASARLAWGDGEITEAALDTAAAFDTQVPGSLS